jgi:hypothetical protein
MLARIPACCGIRQGNDWPSETASFSCDAVCAPFRAVWIYNLSSEFFELILQTQKLVTSGRLALF